MDESVAQTLVFSDDELLLGKLEKFKDECKGFKYIYDSTSPVIDFLAFMWPSQIESLRAFGDLIFIDSTFNINDIGLKAITVTVIDQHYRSILAAVALVANETVENYERLLSFIMKETGDKKRKTLCLISDSAPRMHAAVSKVIPYARHIYCAFHLLREERLFGDCEELSKVEKTSSANMCTWHSFPSHFAR